MKGFGIIKSRSSKSTLNTHSPNPAEHDVPILGDFNTIAGGFAGNDPYNSSKKKYASAVLSLKATQVPQLVINFLTSI